MSEILFKGKTNDQEAKWIYGLYNIVNMRRWESIMHQYDRFEFVELITPVNADYRFNKGIYGGVEVLPGSVCQYIGWSDKDGVKIFDKDFLMKNEIDNHGNMVKTDIYEVVREEGLFKKRLLRTVAWNERKMAIEVTNYKETDEATILIKEDCYKVIGSAFDTYFLLGGGIYDDKSI